MLKQVGKIFLGPLMIVIGPGILGLLILFLTYPPEYVHRVLVWQESDVTSQSLKEDLHQGSLLRGGW
jgi:hypothetical protein